MAIDASGLDDGERQMVTSIRRMETFAARSARNMQDSFGAGFVSFTRALEAPFAAVRRHFEQLATTTSRASPVQQNMAALAATGRRTGTEIEAGAMAGAAGLRALGYAGVAAIATVTLLDKAMRGASDSARGVFPVGIGAQASGLPIERFSAISQALRTNQNVPEADTQGFLSGLNQTLVGARRGDPGAIGRFLALQQAFAQAGVPLDLNANPADVVTSLATRFAGMSPERRIELGTSMGMSQTMAAGLGAAGANLPGEIDAARRTAITSADSAAATDLLTAQEKLATSWEKLSRKIYDELDPGLAQFDRWLSSIIDKLSLTPDPIQAIGVGVAGGNPVLGTAILGAKKVWDWLTGSKSSSTAPGTSGPSSTGRLSFSQMRQLAINAGFAPDKANTMAAIAMAESDGDPTKINTSDPQGSYGLTQINEAAHPGQGRPALDPATAFKEAFAISKGGSDFSPWTTYRTGAYRRVANTPGAFDPRFSDNASYPFPTRTNPQGQPISWTSTDPSLGVNAARAGNVANGPLGAGPGNVSNNLSVGDVHLTGSFKEGAAAGRAVADELHRQMQVNFANSGLTGP